VRGRNVSIYKRWQPSVIVLSSSQIQIFFATRQTTTGYRKPTYYQRKSLQQHQTVTAATVVTFKRSVS